MTKLLLLLFAITVAPASHVYAASVYKWTDKEGQVHYTRTPPPKSMTSDKVPATKVEKSPVVQEPTKPLPATTAISPEAKRLQELCRSAQDSLNEMRGTDKVREHGHEIEISEDERLRRIDELSEKVKEYCTPRKLQPVPQPVQQTVPQPIQRPAPQTQKPAPQPLHKMEKRAEPKIDNSKTQSNQ